MFYLELWLQYLVNISYITGAVGATLNALHLIQGFYFFLITNFILVIQGYALLQWNIVFLFTYYSITSIVGLYIWKRGINIGKWIKV